MKRFMILPILLLFGTLTSFDTTIPVPASTAPFTVVLDAGHGGHDPGNLGNGYMEKNIALNIVLEVGKWLEKQPDIKVIYTRKDDSFVDLYMRGKIANEANADLFVSVHCDSHSSDAHGAGTFVLGLHANEQNFEIAKKENSVIYLEDDYETRYAEYDINSPESIIGLTIMQEEFLDQSIMLAKFMQDEFSGKLKRNDRKVKQAGFIVLHQTFMPSVLVETGFLTNKNEGSYLNSSKGQLEMGRAIAEAIITYKQNVRSEPANVIASAAPPRAVSDSGRTAGTSTAPPKEEVKQVVSEKLAGADKGEVATLNKKEASGSEGNQASSDPDMKLSGELAMASETSSTQVSAGISAAGDNSSRGENSSVVFKVQLLASAKELPLSPAEFKGLNTLSKEPYNNLYRYFYGNTSSYKEAQLLKANADMKGYTTSFIVAYRNGVRIPVEEAVKYVKD